MIKDGAFTMFNTSISRVSPEAQSAQDSLNRSVAAADVIESAINEGMQPGVSEIASQAGQLARTFCTADSLQVLKDQASELLTAVNEHCQTLGDQAQHVLSKAQEVFDKINTAANSWENIDDLDSLGTAIADTAAAAADLSGFLGLLGGIFSVFCMPVATALLTASAVLNLFAENARRVAQQTQDLTPPTDEQTEEPPTDEQTEEPPTDEQTEEPPTDEQTEEPPTDEQTEEPPTDEQTEEPPTDEQTESSSWDVGSSYSDSEKAGDRLDRDLAQFTSDS